MTNTRIGRVVPGADIVLTPENVEQVARLLAVFGKGASRRCAPAASATTPSGGGSRLRHDLHGILMSSIMKNMSQDPKTFKGGSCLLNVVLLFGFCRFQVGLYRF